MGPGPFISALEYATGKKAVVIGKPEKEFFQSAVKSMHRQENATYFMIGDVSRKSVRTLFRQILTRKFVDIGCFCSEIGKLSLSQLKSLAHLYSR